MRFNFANCVFTKFARYCGAQSLVSETLWILKIGPLLRELRPLLWGKVGQKTRNLIARNRAWTGKARNFTAAKLSWFTVSLIHCHNATTVLVGEKCPEESSSNRSFCQRAGHLSCKHKSIKWLHQSIACNSKHYSTQKSPIISKWIPIILLNKADVK